MAEVIGVLASVATLTETAAKLSRLIRSMKKAPDEILALNNEVTDLTILLTRIKDTQAEHPHSLAHILPTLRNLEKSIASLKEVVTRFDGRGTSGLRRFKWTTERDKINRLKEDLRERRVQLDMLLAMTNLSLSFRAQYTLTQLHFLNFEAEKTAANRFETINEQLERIANKLNESIPFSSLSGSQTDDNETIALGIGETPRRCMRSCKCTCHRSAKLNFFSILFVGYTGSLRQAPECQKHLCYEDTSMFRAELTYYFPSWFVRKAFTFSFSVSRLGDPTLTITARNILPSYSEPFLAIERGDTLRILEMLRERSLHPNSIDGVFGRTLLHAAVVSYQVEICELLIQAGADPTLESKPGSSAADQAWDFIFSAPQPDQILKDLARPFARYGDPDSRQLTTLHRLVLGLTSGDVRERTGIAASEIEVPDVWGRTSLWWACRRGDLKATVTLLAQGANPNVDDKEGITPLLAALSSYSSKGYSHSALLLIFQNLLQYGANLNARSKHGWGAAHFASRCEGTGFLELFLSREPNLDIKSGDTNGMTPLHCATSAGNVAVANFLVQNGADPCTRNGLGYTSLDLAASRDHAAIAKCLIQHGADIHRRDPQGRCPLETAITNNAESTVRLLLSQGASRSDLDGCREGMDMKKQDPLTVACVDAASFDVLILIISHFPNSNTHNEWQDTILHYATGRADPELLEKLAAVDISSFDLRARNCNGATPADYLRGGPMQEERRRAFCKLLHQNDFASQIICPQCGKVSGRFEDVEVVSDDEDEFVDCKSEFGG